jgi:hypothetical protein
MEGDTVFGSPEGGACTIEPTTIWFSHDSKNLYLAARCVQADGPALIKAKERDGTVYRDDCVGFFFSPASDLSTIYQIYFNAAGVVFDQKITVSDATTTDPGWNGSYRVAARQTEGEWTLEAAIPFASLKVEPAAMGESWRVNFRRKEIGRDSSADWQVPIAYDPARFGYLRFE